MSTATAIRLAVGTCAFLGLAGCEGQDPFAFLKAPPQSGATDGDTGPVSGETRDVEAPEIFDVADQGLWDGRPSLGGVWVAYPGVQDPERVLIRNAENGSSVVGALFRRERDNPGPRFQISSDAAEALNVFAGAPVRLEVVALKREVIAPEPDPEADESADTTPEAPAGSIDPSVIAAAAIEEAELGPGSSAEPAPAARPAASTLDRPYIQIGIFAVRANAEATEAQMRAAGLAAETLTQTSQGKEFFRVIVGPAQTASARAAALETVRGLGFADAYAVSN